MSDGTEESLYNKQKKTLADINKNLIRWLDNIVKIELKMFYTQINK